MKQHKLTTSNVMRLICHALHKESEAIGRGADGEFLPPENAVMVTGFANDYGFHPERLEETRAEVIGMMDELEPEYFEQDGFTVLFLGFRNDDTTWAMREAGPDWGIIEAFTALAVGLGLARIGPDRALWRSLPGGAPMVRFSKVPLSALPVTLEA